MNKPQAIRTRNGFTLSQERELIKEVRDVLKRGKRHADADALMEDIR
jgi:hypothetical protein